MRLAFVAVGVPGHANPTGALARRLKARGHDVILIATPDAEPLLRSSEVPFVPYCEKDYPTGSMARIQQQLSKLQGASARLTRACPVIPLEAAVETNWMPPGGTVVS